MATADDLQHSGIEEEELAFRVREGPATLNEKVRDNGGKGDS